MPSPSSLVWQPPPKPLHSVFVGTGPYSTWPDLSKTAKPVLTSSTTCVRPTAAFGSGGAAVMEKVPWGPLKPLPTPSTFTDVAGAASV